MKAVEKSEDDAPCAENVLDLETGDGYTTL